MPIQIEVIPGKHVVLQTYTDPLDSDQLLSLQHTMDHDILAVAETKMHIIADFRGVKNLPGTVLSSGAAMLRTAHMNTGMIICVTNNTLVTAMAYVFSSLAPRQPFGVTKTLEEAYAKIDEMMLKAVK
jgi:hypothetical protein